jgi:uncharacterized SAM-binding protein YcdF (DUF218 family)
VLKVVGTLLLIGVACFLGVVGWTMYAETHLPPVRPSDAIIVLGAQVKADGSLSLALQRRLTLARAEYLGQPRLVITCGAQGGDEPAPEGEVMRDWLIAQGVPETDALAETGSFNTLENLTHAKGMMAERGLRTALVVTSDYHVARALALCARLDIEATGVGSASEPAYWVKNHGREALSWIKFWLEGLPFWKS